MIRPQDTRRHGQEGCSNGGLKDTVKIEDLCGTENGPVSVPNNGYNRLVVMVIKYLIGLWAKHMRQFLSMKECPIRQRQGKRR